MTVELKPEHERIIRQQLASGHFSSVDEVLTTALVRLSEDGRFEKEHRREAVRRMLSFRERALSLGEQPDRQFLHEGHRF